MFDRARKSYEARPSEPAKPLSKQLFPSSSPSPHDGNIAQMMKGPTTSSFFGRTVQPNQGRQGVAPLAPRSDNNPRSLESRSGSNLGRIVGRNTVAAVCSVDDAFKDAPDVIDLVDVDKHKTGHSQALAGVYITEDDFSDDGHLDLDFERPNPLPAPPAAQVPSRSLDPSVGSSATNLSWSQSSPSHLAPPASYVQLATQVARSKRESPEEELPSSPPVAKKRKLPKKYEKPMGEREVIYLDDDNFGPTATPAPKTKSSKLPWDATASAMKEQKKQFKNQQKKPLEETGPTGEDVQDAVKARIGITAPVSLSDEQQRVKELVVDRGKSVFFTGPAGTGKSVLMRAIIKDLKKKFARDPERIAVTASTGLAACNIGGMTLHSFSGIGLGKEDADTLIKKIRRNPKAKNRWLRTKVLIIDEVSMLDGDLFDKLSQIGRVLRNNGRAWGGIQLVITGDFFQLPPVPDSSKQQNVKFAFDAATWKTSIDHTIGLTEVFRQKDPEFAQMLNEMRLGKITEATVQTFRSLARPLQFADGLEATELFPTRNEVESSNDRRLRALPGKSFRYDALDTGDPAIREKLLQNVMAPKTMELKKGAQVMLIKNIDDGLVNGSLGTIVDFVNEVTFSMAVNSDGYGSNDEEDPKVRKRLVAFTNALEGASGGTDNREYPWVKFHAVDGSERHVLCMPEEWKVELPTGEVQAARKQLPLILAWALSIHKAQGQTLERVKVDLGKVFEKGQAYVALSRATTKHGLQVLRFQKDKVMAHPRVITFYNQLYKVEDALDKKPATTTFARSASTSNLFNKPKPKPKPVSAGYGSEMFNLDDDEEALAAYG